ncbi:type II toxin-antitoxin system TacA family antitoxin [Rhizobium leguminosarum]|uniref:type II toxin-antitoxin system TacA family antitoxin n=1 Tax=Rhizobium leguminosarum TaxID=384 RepID=UPI001FDF5164
MPSSLRNNSAEVLLERTIFTVSPEIYAEYLARLDAPAQPNDRLKRTMSTNAPWDEPAPPG